MGRTSDRLRELADRIDMHGLGFEGWEDSPAHGWAEELRAIARGGNHFADADKMAATHEGAEDE